MKRRAWAAPAAIVVVACVAFACGSSSSGSGFNGGSSSGSSGGASSGSGSGSFGDGGNFGDGGGGDGGHPTPTMPVTIDDCPGPVSASQASALQAGGPVDPAMKWLYPYDATIWPGGLLAPVLCCQAVVHALSGTGSCIGLVAPKQPLYSKRFDFRCR